MSSEFRTKRTRLRQFIVSYAPDWIVTWVLWWTLNYIAHHVTPFKRQFSLTDLSLRYPYAVQQTVSTQLLWSLSSLLPLGVQIVVSVLFMRSWWDLHHSALGLLLSITLTTCVTQLVKVTVGRPRPDVISRCQPMPGSEDPLWGLSSVDICTQTSKDILDDGWRSFPSGHASLSFAGLGFLTFYLAGKLRLFDGRGYAGKVWLTLVPVGIASWVALTRTMDYRHHWQDVLTGSVLGLVVAYLSYRQYYPRLGSETAHVPFTTRLSGEELDYDLDGRAAVFRDDDAENGEEARLAGGNTRDPHQSR